MKQPKPILTIKEKCKECGGTGTAFYGTSQYLNVCVSCGGRYGNKGLQTTELYLLRDFEKCNFCGGIGKSMLSLKGKLCVSCDGMGYKIPFKNYEIKKVSEMQGLVRAKLFTHNLKEDDKIVLRRK